MSEVFADTFYFFALLNKHDEAHEKALQYSSLIDKIATTEWVLTEWQTVLRHHGTVPFL